MAVAELKEKPDSYFDRGYGEYELKTIDQSGNGGEVLGMYDYTDPNCDEGSTVVIEVA